MTKIPKEKPGDESIGRPDAWREGRYEEDRESGADSVERTPGEGIAPPDTLSTPVTKKDYE